MRVQFVSEDTGKVLGFNGTFLRTTNGGAAWIAQQTPSTTVMRAISFIDANRGITVGDYGTIITTTTGGVVVSVEQPHRGGVPEAFRLGQNYPNPFNPITVISFQLSVSGFVTLKVYNVLGEEVATLVDETKTPGRYEVKFDASIFPSGIYFYRLIAGEFVETKKMLLLR